MGNHLAVDGVQRAYEAGWRVAGALCSLSLLREMAPRSKNLAWLKAAHELLQKTLAAYL